MQTDSSASNGAKTEFVMLQDKFIIYQDFVTHVLKVQSFTRMWEFLPNESFSF